MVSLAWSCVAVGLFVTAPPAGCEAAPSESLTVPSARVVARIDSGRASYRLVGRMTMSEGYRMCAAIRAAPARSYSAGRVLWLAGRDGSYHSLTAGGRRCRRRAVWFDSHPPTLEPVRRSASMRGRVQGLRTTCTRRCWLSGRSRTLAARPWTSGVSIASPGGETRTAGPSGRSCVRSATRWWRFTSALAESSSAWSSRRRPGEGGCLDP